MEANNAAHADDVTIQLQAKVYKLTLPIGAVDDQRNGDLNLNGNVRIQGLGMDRSIIDANAVDRAIFVGRNAFVTLADLTIQGGRPPTGAGRTGVGNGGGIYSEGALSLERCKVQDNVVLAIQNGGAGIHSHLGSLSLVDSIVQLNHGDTSLGGGIESYGTTTITRSSLILNTAYAGAGIFHSGGAGTLKMANSTVSRNTAALLGGGICLSSTTLAKLNNVTVTRNDAANLANEGAEMYLDSATAVLTNSLFGNGGLVFGGVSCGGTGSTMVSAGYNMIADPGNCSTSGTFTHAVPSLSGSAFNGGLTPTQAIISGGAIDGGDPAGCYDPSSVLLTTDQRGVKRLIGAACDLGAFELEPIGDANGDGAVNVGDVFTLINFLFASGALPPGRANVNGDMGIDIQDVFYLVNYLFANGPAPK
jgi:hypothetical protein